MAMACFRADHLHHTHYISRSAVALCWSLGLTFNKAMFNTRLLSFIRKDKRCSRIDRRTVVVFVAGQ